MASLAGCGRQRQTRQSVAWLADECVNHAKLQNAGQLTQNKGCSPHSVTSLAAMMESRGGAPFACSALRCTLPDTVFWQHNVRAESSANHTPSASWPSLHCVRHNAARSRIPHTPGTINRPAAEAAALLLSWRAVQPVACASAPCRCDTTVAWVCHLQYAQHSLRTHAILRFLPLERDYIGILWATQTPPRHGAGSSELDGPRC